MILKLKLLLLSFQSFCVFHSGFTTFSKSKSCSLFLFGRFERLEAIVLLLVCGSLLIKDFFSRIRLSCYRIAPVLKVCKDGCE